MCLNKAVSLRQLCAGGFAALLLPALTLLPGCGWASVALGAAAAGGLYALLWTALRLRRGGALSKPRPCPLWAAIPGVLWLLLAAARTAAYSPRFFPESGGAAWIGLGVLALAVCAARRGLPVLLRCAAVLFVLLCAVFGTVLLCSLPQLRPDWLAPRLSARELGAAFAVFLLPGPGLRFLPRLHGPRRGWPGWALAFALAATAAAAIAEGCLSPALAQEPLAFDTLSRSLSLFGVMLRLEVLVRAALTACAFFACALLFCLADALLEEALPRRAGGPRRTLLLGAAAALLLYPSLVPPTSVLLIGGGIFSVAAAARPLAVEAGKTVKKQP